MAEQNVNHDEVSSDERLDDSDLEHVSGGAIIHDGKLRKQEQADKLMRSEQGQKCP